MKEAIVFGNGRHKDTISIVNTKEELINEINHYQCFWLSSVGGVYSSKVTPIEIKVKGLTEEDAKWLSARMR